MTTVSFLPDAEEEMIESARYYESKCEGLGNDFLAEVERAIKNIQDHPTSAPLIRSNIRRRLLHRFPFGLLYTIEKQQCSHSRGNASSAPSWLLERASRANGKGSLMTEAPAPVDPKQLKELHIKLDKID